MLALPAFAGFAAASGFAANRRHWRRALFIESAAWKTWTEDAEEYEASLRSDASTDLQDERWKALRTRYDEILRIVRGNLDDADAQLLGRIDREAGRLMQLAQRQEQGSNSSPLRR